MPIPNFGSIHHVNQLPPKPNPKFLSLILKFIVMSLILSLFLIFIGLAAILLVHLLIAGRFLHLRRRRNPWTTTFSLHDIQTHLPPVQYSRDDDDDSNCLICLDYFKNGETCRVIPVCDHMFHARCVDTWLLKVASCPFCRTGIRFDNNYGVSDLVDDEDDESKFFVGHGFRYADVSCNRYDHDYEVYFIDPVSQ